MLRISKLTDYGTVVMTELARDPAQVVSAAHLAERVGITLPTVSKLLKLLARADLVQSFRGAEGGYQLARQPEQISIASIIDVLEGPIALTECAGHDHSCSQENQCGVRANWQVINGAVRQALEGVSLAQMTRRMSPADNGQSNTSSTNDTFHSQAGTHTAVLRPAHSFSG